MKIALAHKRLELRGGAERVLYLTAKGLRDRGHEVHLFCQRFRFPSFRGFRPLRSGIRLAADGASFNIRFFGSTNDRQIRLRRRYEL